MNSSSKIIKYLSLLLLIVSAIKIWPSDRWPGIALLAYAPPLLMLLVIVSLVFGSFLFRIPLRGFWRFLLLLSAILNAAFLIADNRSLLRTNPATGEQKGIRLFHWNVRGSRNAPQAVLSEIMALHPDIICLSEPKPKNNSPNFPEYATLIGSDWKQMGHANVLFVSRLPMERLDLLGGEGIRGIYVRIGTAPAVRILLIDMAGDLDYHRLRGMRHLSSFLHKHRQEPPDIILGDFNTPSGSYSLDSSLAGNYHDAYYHVGSSLGYTWTTWLPLIRIDLIFVDNTTNVFDHKIGYSRKSDHAWQSITFVRNSPK